MANSSESKPPDHRVSLTRRNITPHISGPLSFTSDTENSRGKHLIFKSLKMHPQYLCVVISFDSAVTVLFKTLITTQKKMQCRALCLIKIICPISFSFFLFSKSNYLYLHCAKKPPSPPHKVHQQHRQFCILLSY